MRLKLTTNLGTVDARKYGLTVEDATEGSEVNVDDEGAKVLISRGWAVEPGSKKRAARTPTSADFDDTPAGVLAREAVTGPDEDEDEGDLGDNDFDAMTKEELRAYADANNITGVSALNKDDLLKAVKKGARSR
jgi:cytochrome oxidase assembly protein ShyY1